MNTSPALNAETRTQEQVLRDLIEKFERLVKEIAYTAKDPEVSNAADTLLEELPFDRLTELELALAEQREERETRAYHEDRRAMYRPPSV